MCHAGTSQGTSVMRSFSTLSATLLATALLGNLALVNTAQAAVEIVSGPAQYNDQISAIRNSYNDNQLVKSGFSVDDLQDMQKTVKANATELDYQKRTINEQARLIEELKRSSGSSSSSNNSDLSDIKRTIKDQDSDLKNLSKQVDDLKRSSGSSSSSSSSELSNLKRQVSDQDRTIDQLKRTVEDLSRKVK
jgi:flagellar biosynthesis chaperone FliJ